VLRLLCAGTRGEDIQTLGENDRFSFQEYLCLSLTENLEASTHPIYEGKQHQPSHTVAKTAVIVDKNSKCFGREITDTCLL